MSTGVTAVRVSDALRRDRLLRRHRLIPDHYADSVCDATDSLVALHATTASTVYLSAWARIPGFRAEEMSAALYGDRSLVKQMAMRRTVFVFCRDALPDAIGAIGARVAAGERTNMRRDMRRSGEFDDPDAWIDAAAQMIRDALAAGPPGSAKELRERLPELVRQVQVSEGKPYVTRSSLTARVLTMLNAAGDIARGPHGGGGWHLSRPVWADMASWLGGPLDLPSAHDGHVAMVRRWLAAFGPGTETDLVWWLGSTKGAVRAALAELDTVEVLFEDGTAGIVLADDVPTADEEAAAAEAAPHPVLLPELDPTPMGYKQRSFFLGAHAAKVFDSNGNGGQTAWWDGRIVGGWYRRGDGSIGIHPLEPLPRAARRALDARAEELAAWAGDTPLGLGYPGPYLKDVTDR